MINLARRTILMWLSILPVALSRPARALMSPSEQRYICTFNECEPYVYDPLMGDVDNVNGDDPIPPGTAFDALPHDWLCPVCGSPLSYFEKTDEPWVDTD